MKKRIIYLSLAIFLSMQFVANASDKKEMKNSKPKVDHCVSCHTEMDNLPSDFMKDDIHRRDNFSCSVCHGGDPSSDDQDAAMSPAKGFIGVPKKKDIPKICGKCHSDINVMRVYQPRIATDQVEQYYTSMHGKKLLAGDSDVAECASCHTAHSILPVKDPRATVYKLNVPNTCNKCHGNAELMKKYNIPTNQLEEYTKSVHGVALLKNNDLGAPACNDCHGNHGAMPPGITSISHVCGTCHITNMEYFEATKMSKAFDENGFHACEQCHGNHGIVTPTDDMVGIGKQSKCIDCHTEGDEGYAAGKKINEDIVKFKNAYNTASSKLNEVKEKGMNDVEIGFILQDAKQDLIQSRTLIHTFDTTKVGAKTKDGIQIANKASVLADKQIDEYYTRRNGFAAATLAFLIIIVALYFKIKERENRKDKNPS